MSNYTWYGTTSRPESSNNKYTSYGKVQNAPDQPKKQETPKPTYMTNSNDQRRNSFSANNSLKYYNSMSRQNIQIQTNKLNSSLASNPQSQNLNTYMKFQPSNNQRPTAFPSHTPTNTNTNTNTHTTTRCIGTIPIIATSTSANPNPNADRCIYSNTHSPMYNFGGINQTKTNVSPNNMHNNNIQVSGSCNKYFPNMYKNSPTHRQIYTSQQPQIKKQQQKNPDSSFSRFFQNQNVQRPEVPQIKTQKQKMLPNQTSISSKTIDIKTMRNKLDQLLQQADQFPSQNNSKNKNISNNVQNQRYSPRQEYLPKYTTVNYNSTNDNQVQKLSKQNKQLSIQLTNNKKTNETLTQQKQGLQKKCKQLTQNNMKLDGKVKSLTQQLNIINQQLQLKIRQETTVKNKNQQLFKSISQVQKQFKHKSIQLNQINDSIKQKMVRKQLLNQNIATLEENQANIKGRIKLHINNLQEIKQKIQIAHGKLNQIRKPIPQVNNMLSIPPEVLQNEIDRQYVIRQIYEIHPNKNIKNTKVVYIYPLMEEMPPHNTVDQKSNFFILIKLKPVSQKHKRNLVVAMYPPGPLSQGCEMNDRVGFVSAVTNQRTFYLNKKAIKPKLTFWDNHRFVFDCFVLNYNLKTPLFQVNLNLNNKSFNTGDSTPQTFIGEGGLKDKAEVIAYEIHQIFFE